MAGSPPTRRRGRRGRALLWLLVPAAAAAYVLIGGVGSSAPTARVSPTFDEPQRAVDDVVDRAVERSDGPVTVTLTEAETTALVRAGLAQSQAPALRDVMVDLVPADGGADGRMIVAGRLSEQPLPVRATVDLDVVEASVRPTVRDATIGPLAVPASVRDDLNRQLRELVVLADQRVEVRRLRTTDTEMVVTGRRR